jgi:hypothetical protein
MISDANRKRFEGIGLDQIKRELAVGNAYYLSDEQTRAAAEEWATEQEVREQDRIGRLATVEAERFQSSRRWTIANFFVAIIAAIAAVIAAWPVLKGWLN